MFMMALFVFIIPHYKRDLLAEKEEMLKELTCVATSILRNTYKEEQSGALTRKEAQQKAINSIKELRYGAEQKDYFWIIDLDLTMIMHPYNSELNGKNLSNYRDEHNNLLFVDSVKKVKDEGGGCLDYWWQWMDDSKRVEPKHSYVTGFKPWGWVIGTGIYLPTVKKEIRNLTAQMINIVLLISTIIIALITILLYHSINLEHKRQLAEAGRKASNAKYKLLVNASTEGLLMVLEGRFVYFNQMICTLLGYDNKQFNELQLSDLMPPSEKNSWLENIQNIITASKQTLQFETGLLHREKHEVKVLVTLSPMTIEDKSGTILVIKDFSGNQQRSRKRVEEERENLIIELQSAQSFLNEPIRNLAIPLVQCPTDKTIFSVTKLMDRVQTSIVTVCDNNGTALGIVTNSDICRRAIATGLPLDTPIHEVMSSPIVTISDNALVFEASLLMQDKKVQHLILKNNKGKAVSMISNQELLKIQQYCTSSLLSEVRKATCIDDLRICHRRLPRLIKGLVDSGAHGRSITRVITTINDALLESILELAIAQLGSAPCEFAFMVFGSEGREEQTLKTDQDNAIIFADSAKNDSQAKEYFRELALFVCDNLHEIGIAYCPGDIMAKNPKWCQPLANWKQLFSNWISTSQPNDLLQVNIFFDYRYIFGNRSLVKELSEHITQKLAKHPPFFLHLAQNALHYKAPLGMFGQIVTKKDIAHDKLFNIKEAMLPIVNFARLYSYKHHIAKNNTLARLEELHKQEVITTSCYQEIKQVYQYLLRHRFQWQTRDLTIEPNNHLDLGEMNEIEQELLKKVLSQISTIQAKISFDFKGRAS